MNIKKYKGMRIVECAQGDVEWFSARLGSVTASRVAEALSMLKRNTKDRKAGEPSKTHDDYMIELATERLTGRPVEHFVSMAMEFGIVNEKVARTAYEMAQGVEVEENEPIQNSTGYETYDNLEVERVGFVLHPTIPKYAGASPDGLVGDDGLVEFKVPNTETHLRYIQTAMQAGDARLAIPDAYRKQMMWQMACTGRKWCDFVSFDPRLTVAELFIARLDRNEKEIAEMEFGVIRFLAEVEALCEQLRGYSGKFGLSDRLRRSLQPGPGPEAAGDIEAQLQELDRSLNR